MTTCDFIYRASMLKRAFLQFVRRDVQVAQSAEHYSFTEKLQTVCSHFIFLSDNSLISANKCVTMEFRPNYAEGYK